MNIEYKDIHEFTEKELERLFLSVKWSSGHFPEKLKNAMMNFETVYLAWDGDKLIGMLCALDDGVMTAYIHYLLVDPEYQGTNIGRTLIEMAKQKYKDYLRIVLIAYKNAEEFYKKCGFEGESESQPMQITTLWT